MHGWLSLVARRQLVSRTLYCITDGQQSSRLATNRGKASEDTSNGACGAYGILDSGFHTDLTHKILNPQPIRSSLRHPSHKQEQTLIRISYHGESSVSASEVVQHARVLRAYSGLGIVCGLRSFGARGFQRTDGVLSLRFGMRVGEG